MYYADVKWQATGRERNMVILDFNGAREQARQKNITESLSLTQVKQVKANSSQSLHHQHCQTSPLKQEVQQLKYIPRSVKMEINF